MIKLKLILATSLLLPMLAGVLVSDVQAQAPAPAPDLAKQSQNPLSSLVSVPFFMDFNFNSGIYDRTKFVMNVKPVYPILGGKWNIITRAIIPIISQPVGPSLDKTGLGDVNFSAFFSPAKASAVTWGVGPSITVPTAVDDLLGADKWTAGPTAIALSMPGHFVLGALVGQSWSFAGDDDREDVSFMAIQYFVNYNLKNGWAIKSIPTITANWKADDGQQWTVPFGAGIGKVGKMGTQPYSLTVSGFYNVEKPDNASTWTFEVIFTLLFPKGH
jgi:hypothetical protein